MDFSNALRRFEEILQLEKNDVVRDSAIKRFEIIFELSWKVIKAFVEERHGTTCVSPRNCFREAFRLGLLDHDENWLRMSRERNYTAHIYREALAEKIYTDLPRALIAFKKLKNALDREIKEKE
jgi:nucleotidyltransferase substrate binding protein (TIGR01987 family)